jgi:hypothetical protein
MDSIVKSLLAVGLGPAGKSIADHARQVELLITVSS